MKTIDQEKLALSDGQKGNPTHVAVHDKVYDLTESEKWKDGVHMARHKAGRDLTRDMKAAPHGMEVFKNFPVLCRYTQTYMDQSEGDVKIPRPLNIVFEKFPFLKRHPHPLTVHFPIAFIFAAFTFMLLFFITKKADLEIVAFYLMVSATLTTPAAIITGFQSWWLFYGCKTKGNLLIKMIAGPMIWILTAALTFWRFSSLDILSAGGLPTIIYAVVMIVLVGLVALAGSIGGQLTFPE